MNGLNDLFDANANPPMFRAPDHALWPAIRAALMTVYDPEMTENVFDLGLIYRVEITDLNGSCVVDMDMTLSRANCPAADDLPRWIKQAVEGVDGVGYVNVNIVYEPQWTMSHVSPAARVGLNLL